jgi:hypothetical protein
MHFWGQFSILYAAALVGAACLIPYTLRLVRSSQRARKVSPTTLAVAGFAQNAVLFGVVVFVGLTAAHAIGFGAPYVAHLVGGNQPTQPWASTLLLAGATGAAGGFFLTVVDLVLLPRLPALLNLARKTSLGENFLASFYGGINEELLMRLLGISGLLWLASRVSPSAASSPAAVWGAIIVMAGLFALGHLPAARAVVGHINQLIVIRSLVLNGPVALLCGWLFWHYGIEAAVVGHLSADLIYHVGGTALLNANDRNQFLNWIPTGAAEPDK